MSNELVAQEQRDLARCEKTIEKGMATFVEVGQALARIRDGKLYRESHKSFAAYVKDRWQRTSRWAELTIESSATTERVANAKHVSQKPNARQASALSKAPPEQQPEIWEQVVEEHGEDVTAAKVSEAVEAAAEEDEPKPEPLDPFLADACKQINAIIKGITARHDDEKHHAHYRSWATRVCGELKACRATMVESSPAEWCGGGCNKKTCKKCLGTGYINRKTARSLKQEGVPF